MRRGQLQLSCWKKQQLRNYPDLGKFPGMFSEAGMRRGGWATLHSKATRRRSAAPQEPQLEEGEHPTRRARSSPPLQHLQRENNPHPRLLLLLHRAWGCQHPVVTAGPWLGAASPVNHRLLEALCSAGAFTQPRCGPDADAM